MYFFSNLGNINCKNEELENTPDYILNALNHNYYVKINVIYYNDNLYLRNKFNDIKIDLSFLEKNEILIECLDFLTLNFFIMLNSNKIHYFYNNNNINNISLTSKQFIISYKETSKYTILIDSKNYHRDGDIDIGICLGICSNFIESYKHIYDK